MAVVVGELTRLFVLRRAGALDDAQFAAAKAAALPSSGAGGRRAARGGARPAAARARKGAGGLGLYARLPDGATVAVELDAGADGAALRAALVRAAPHLPASLTVSFAGAELRDDVPLADAGVTAEAVVSVATLRGEPKVTRTSESSGLIFFWWRHPERPTFYYRERADKDSYREAPQEYGPAPEGPEPLAAEQDVSKWTKWPGAAEQIHDDGWWRVSCGWGSGNPQYDQCVWIDGRIEYIWRRGELFAVVDHATDETDLRHGGRRGSFGSSDDDEE